MYVVHCKPSALQRQGSMNEQRILLKAEVYKQTNKQTLWPLVRKRTISPERPLIVGKM
jgi:hypothetical protein